MSTNKNNDSIDWTKIRRVYDSSIQEEKVELEKLLGMFDFRDSIDSLREYKANRLETINIADKDYSLSTIDYVKIFHKKFGHPVENKPNIKNKKLNDLRIKLFSEELTELEDALNIGDAVKALDALTDLQVVLDGAYLSLGFHNLKNAAFLEVHNSNMSKLGTDGKPIYREDGKIMKGPNYKAPELDKLF